MSTIGPGNLGNINLAGSIAGAQRGDVSDERARAEAADRKSEQQIRDRHVTAAEDVSDPELSEDRDADGYLAYGGHDAPVDEESVSAEADETTDAAPKRASHDESGTLGKSLDLDA